MARKNQWEQFADNFTTFYDMGNKLQTGMASKKIMDEEVVVQSTGLGPGPQSVYQANYGGKNYNEEITPEMLRGLQYDRIADVRTKFGDATGGMELREKAAGIRNDRANLKSTNLSNELAEKRLEFDVEQARLENVKTTADTESVIAGTDVTKTQLDFLKKTLDDRVFTEELKKLGLEWDNKSKEYKALVEKATMDDEIAISGLKVTKSELANKNAILANMRLKITNSGELIQLDIDKQTKDTKIEGAKLDLEAKEIENLNNTLKGTGMMYDNALGLISVETGLALQDSNIKAGIGKNAAEIEQSKLEETTARLENNSNVALLEYSKIIKDGGNFTNKAGKKITGAEWLREGWTGDDATLKVLQNIDDDELNQLMREGTMIIKNVEAALTGTRDMTEPAILKLIDEQDSIPNNVQILQSEEGEFIRMVQTDAEGKNPITIAEGKNWSDFSDNLVASITPMKSVTLAKANADIALVQAQTEEINAKIANNGIDIQKVNAEWASIEKEMQATEQSPLDISNAKMEFVDSYIVNSKGLGAKKGDKYKVEVIEP